jgi:hypothetical protein
MSREFFGADYQATLEVRGCRYDVLRWRPESYSVDALSGQVGARAIWLSRFG